ncbi:NAD-dependent epimerase/dehydratase family protein [Paenibacillus sp. NPDC058177]|uniref:NAD-dependent epimerase/dehydratase family protein n=1 Tax=Paenibacillus sp. NPDC058177 TaxID=3346369 RepID=UPI0036DF94F7
MNILITGASGFIGRALVKHLADKHYVICLSRKAPEGAAAYVQGSFDVIEDLKGLDAYDIEAVIHLAAVTGGCSEEEGLAVNVLGTRRLFRYLLDRGCRKFITASSIAVAGGLDEDFVPLELPIPDEHPCLATDAYGLSKAMVEELTRYFHRIHTDADFINLRLGAVAAEDWIPPILETGSRPPLPFITMAHVYADDVVRGIAAALHAPPRPGVRTLNLVGPDVTSNLPVTKIMSNILGDFYNLDYYHFPGHNYRPLYTMDRFKEEFGFVPVRSTRGKKDGNQGN